MEYITSDISGNLQIFNFGVWEEIGCLQRKYYFSMGKLKKKNISVKNQRILDGKVIRSVAIDSWLPSVLSLRVKLLSSKFLRKNRKKMKLENLEQMIKIILHKKKAFYFFKGIVTKKGPKTCRCQPVVYFSFNPPLCLQNGCVSDRTLSTTNSRCAFAIHSAIDSSFERFGAK